MTLRTVSGDRRVKLRSCFNFRDVGGYRTNDGLRTRWRRLYRADGLHHLRPGDEKELAGLGLSTVIDLRTPAEVAAQGAVRLPVQWHHLPLADVLAGAHGAAGASAEAAAVAESYLATLDAGCDTVREILAVLTDPSSYPAVVCCPSGIDRTGIVTAVVLGLLGVPDHVIITDYAASRESVLRRLGRMRFEHPSAVKVDVDRYGPGALGVAPDAMVRFIQRIRAEHGSFAGYAESLDMAGAVPYLRATLLQLPS